MSRLYFKTIQLSLLLCASIFVMLMVSCKNENIVAVMIPGKTTALTIDKVTVRINLASNNLMKNVLSLENKSRDTLSVDSSNVVLSIGRAGFTLRAVNDFRKYASTRYSAAKEECGQAKYQYACADGVESFFKPFLRGQAFEFGKIKPGEKKTGFIAFNLPDPFNRSEEALRLADTLRAASNLLEANITVSVSKSSGKNIDFVFPVNISIFSNAGDSPLKIMRNF